MNFKLSEAVEIPLKVSVWVVDENRYNDLLAQRKDSIIWEITALIWICYLNACRYAKADPVANIEDVELRIDELYSTKPGKKYIADLSAEIGREIKALSETYENDGEEKKSQTVKPKRQIGKR